MGLTADRQAVEFGVEIGEYRGGPGPAARVPTPTSRAAHPRAVRRGVLPPADPVREHGQRKLYRPQLTEDGNVEISGRDLRGASQGERSLRQSASGQGAMSGVPQITDR